jgi:hypothetical protein
MTLQAILDNEALKLLSEDFNNKIKSSSSFNNNQMRCYTINKFCNLIKPLIRLNEKEITTLELELINYFKFTKWLKE